MKKKYQFKVWRQVVMTHPQEGEVEIEAHSLEAAQLQFGVLNENFRYQVEKDGGVSRLYLLPSGDYNNQ